jgi:valyl-tRNA synthetase
VLDTWFSSALWPFVTLGWPEATPELRAFYPTDVLVTARDILFLWVARMVMMGLEFTGREPFEQVYVHSVIQAPDGQPMSKSRGTGIDPLEEIERHGADAVRFGLLAMSSTQDVRYKAEKISQGEALANKLFNASRFVLRSVDLNAEPAPRPTTVEDRWILSRLQRIRTETAERIDRFDFSHTALGLYDFVYGELCDWYIEFVKARLGGDDLQTLSSNLLFVLRETVAIAHPVIPFVTEEIWSYLPESATRAQAEAEGEGLGEGLLAGHRLNAPDPALIDVEAEETVARAIAAVQSLRAWRNEVGASPREHVRARLDAEGYDSARGLIERMARFEFVGADGAGVGGEPLTAVDIPGGSVAVLAVDADLDAARRRSEARRRALESDIERSERKLANPGFVEKAPPAVVEGERAKLAELRAQLEAL